MINKVFIKEKIFKMVQEHPGISSTLIATEIGMSRVSAYTYLQNLVSEEQIRIAGKGKATRYFPQEMEYLNTSIGIKSRLTPSQVHILKMEILAGLYEKYEEYVSEDDIDTTFNQYCMYITSDNVIHTGFTAFIFWCLDSRHDFSGNIVAKAIEYLDLIGSIIFTRNKNGFLDGTQAAKANLKDTMKVGFDLFYFCMPSVLRNGFGRTRTSLELSYGKKNSNVYLLGQAIELWIDPIRTYVRTQGVDVCIFTPPTEGRTVQFRDILEKKLDLRIPQIKAEKVSLFGKVLEPQKDIKDREKRVRNAMISLEVTIPRELSVYQHILILDDSFTTGATPNAIALRLREAGYAGKISIITICGSFDYDLAITEDEI